MSMPGWSRPRSPRNLLTTNPATRSWSALSSRATVPNMAANTPPRSMSPTTTVGSRPCRASPRLTKSVSRRLISAGLPAPSQTTTSYSVRSWSKVSNTVPASRDLSARKLPASTRSTASPSTTTWLEWSLPGLSSTGLNRTSAGIPQAAACIACARPISPPRPSGPTTTAELLDMFWALNGATRTPRRWSQRQMPAVTTLLPASEVVPATSRPPFIAGAGDGRTRRRPRAPPRRYPRSRTACWPD